MHFLKAAFAVGMTATVFIASIGINSADARTRRDRNNAAAAAAVTAGVVGAVAASQNRRNRYNRNRYYDNGYRYQGNNGYRYQGNSGYQYPGNRVRGYGQGVGGSVGPYGGQSIPQNLPADHR